VTGLIEQAKEGSFEQQLDGYEGALMGIRSRAAAEHLIQQRTFDAWASLSSALIKLRPQVRAKKVDSGLQGSAAGYAAALYSSLAIETQGREELIVSSEGATSLVNPYTGATSMPSLIGITTIEGPGAGLSLAILSGQWDSAYNLYQQLVAGLDQWIIDRLKEVKGKGDTEAQQAELLSKRKSALSDIESKHPIRVVAVFHPDEKFKTESGFVAEIPLALYAYKEDNTWYLRNLTNPDKAYHVKAESAGSSDAPPLSLFAELNDPDHFPVGVIHFEIPGRYGGQVRTTSYLTWKKFFTYLGLGLAAVGFTLATFGTGTVAVIGTWALAGSALAGGVAAGIDIGEGLRQGDLNATRVTIDIGQIVASLAGVSALRSGLIVHEALTAAEQGAPLAGRAAEMVVFFQKVYVVSTAARITADTVTIAAFSIETAKQLDEIQNGPGEQVDKDRAKALLLSQLAVSGGLLALSIKGELPKLGSGRNLVLHFPDKNGPPVATVEGMEVPSGTGTSITSSTTETGPVAPGQHAPGGTVSPPESKQIVRGPSAAFTPGKAPRSPAEVTKFLRDSGLEESEIVAFGGADASRLGPRTAERVGRLAKHFTAPDLKALGKFLWEYDIVMDDAMAEMLMERVEAGRLAETLKMLEVAAEYGKQAEVIFNLESAMDLAVTTPSSPRTRGVAGPKVDPPWRVAEKDLLAALDELFGPGWKVSPRIQAPGARPGEFLGSTVPEYYRPDLKKAFEVKRLNLIELGIGPAGQSSGTLSKASVEALDRARRQLAGRRWNLPEGTEQSIVFNVTGQGVTDVIAVGKRLDTLLGQRLIVYDRLFVQNGDVLTKIR
jgi:hypothetical protein